jgi:hypothetical protein
MLDAAAPQTMSSAVRPNTQSPPRLLRASAATQVSEKQSLRDSMTRCGTTEPQKERGDYSDGLSNRLGDQRP